MVIPPTALHVVVFVDGFAHQGLSQAAGNFVQKMIGMVDAGAIGVSFSGNIAIGLMERDSRMPTSLGETREVTTFIVNDVKLAEKVAAFITEESGGSHETF